MLHGPAGGHQTRNEKEKRKRRVCKAMNPSEKEKEKEKATPLGNGPQSCMGLPGQKKHADRKRRKGKQSTHLSNP